MQSSTTTPIRARGAQLLAPPLPRSVPHGGARGVPRRGRPRWQRRLARALAIAASGIALSTAGAQDSTAAASPVVRTLIGDLALMMRRDASGTLDIGAAGAARTLTLSVRASDALRWSDSASRLLVRPRTRRRRPAPPNDSVQIAQRARAVLEEPGVGAGAFVLTRLDSAGARSFQLFIDDAELSPLRQPLELSEATTLVRLMRKAATRPKAAKVRKPKPAPRSAKPRTNPAKPAARTTAKPPAQPGA